MKKQKKPKTFKIRKCPKCNSENVGVVVGKDKKGEWECYNCKWSGKNIQEIELGEEDFLKYLDERGEAVS
ncbi:MAG: hypothetical protein KKF68_02125 [Nanoarchaeota archaeon]|nr:hypothetical protein [Nanoarchaeota archaeon]